MSFYGKKWVWCLRKCYQQFQRLFSLNYWMLTQKVSHWICYIDEKTIPVSMMSKRRWRGGGGGVKATSFPFPKGKTLWEQSLRESSLIYSNKTSHKTYLREGRSTFAVSTVVNQLRKRYMVKSDTAISYIRSDSMGILQQDAPIGETHARAGRIVYGSPWDTSAEDVSMWTGWDSLETMYKLRLTEFVFKCLKGYTVTEFKDLFLQRNSGRRRNENIILPRPEQLLSGTPHALEE